MDTSARKKTKYSMLLKGVSIEDLASCEFKFKAAAQESNVATIFSYDSEQFGADGTGAVRQG